MIVFVSGGARSGKSAIAEQQVVNLARGATCYYLATAAVYDAEMNQRVARHREARDRRWVTVEEPVNIDQAIANVPNGSAVLLDCLTLWASQVLYASSLSEEQGMAILTKTLLDARTRELNLVIVSNDINEALPPLDAETWRYLAFLQRAHRRLATEADSVIEVIAGSFIEWKPEREPCA